MKPTLAPPRHSRTPTCTRCIGCCAWAAADDASSRVVARPARMVERGMRKNLRLKRRDASRESGRPRCLGARILYDTTAVAVPDFATVIPGRAQARTRNLEDVLSVLTTS